MVIDISHWQLTPDWAELERAGIVGVILKATEGTSYKDPTFDDRYKAALEKGFAVATYHFLKHGNVFEQMEWYVEVVAPRAGERMVIDYEDAACVLDDLIAACRALMELAPDVNIAIYGANGFLGDQLRGQCDEFLGTFPLWVASYTSNDEPTTTDLAATWPVWSLWQYTDSAWIGDYGPLDGNRFNGTEDDCIDWIGPTEQALPPSVPVMDEVVIHVKIEAPDGVKVRVVVEE